VVASGPKYYGGAKASFTLFAAPGRPQWRPPQLGALGALLQHWSLPRSVPALVSIPTGTGKTAIGIGAAHIAAARRVLVVVPSTELRRQTVAAFQSENDLLRIGALHRKTEPIVAEVTGRVNNWHDLEAADVVVALPNSISPVHYAAAPAPSEMFDLVIIDEAHHAPAPTWRAILDHFSRARGLLLTATPRRRDGQKVPGEHIYHYPLRRALDERIFNPVTAQVLSLPATYTQGSIDQLIVATVAGVLNDPAHATSTTLVRAATRKRATELAELYKARGISVEVLHAGLKGATQQAIINGLRSGAHRVVAVVGMLIEGFDLPSLRVLAYHDKHKSIPATAQLIGRLARVDACFPQPSVLVTARDIDVFPELQGVLRSLYDEDEDWATVLPGILDDQIAEEIANHRFTRQFTPPPPTLSLDAVHPIRRSVLLEVPPTSGWIPAFTEQVLPDELAMGQPFRRATVLYAGLSGDATTLLIVTTAVVRPRWHDSPGLDSNDYALHLVSFRQPTDTRLPSLLLFNTEEVGVIAELLRLFGGTDVVASADPAKLEEAFDSLDRVSVSSVGLRNTYASRGIPSYRMYAGSSVERGLRDADTAFGSLGHAMAQVVDNGVAFTAGIATGKGKYWEMRHAPLREYDAFVTKLAERYWFPPTSVSGQLLPQLTRGRRLTTWPTVAPVAVELDYALFGGGWDVAGCGPLEFLDFRADAVTPGSNVLPLRAVAIQDGVEVVVWHGCQALSGQIVAVGSDLDLRRGFSGSVPLSEMLSERPPTIFFFDGTTVHGSSVFESRTRTHTLPRDLLSPHNWVGVDICAETRTKAATGGIGKSVHEALEEYLEAQPRRGKRRWIICNDGAGEFADYIVIETGRSLAVHVGLWHAKFAGGAPSVRVTDLQEVTVQAMKSRRWLTDVRFWQLLGDRLKGRAAPRATLVDGNARLLDVLCGENEKWAKVSFRRTRPIVTGHVGIAQPGLARALLETELGKPDPGLSAVQSSDILSMFSDCVSMVAPTVTVLCSS
jgi:superfamily II DNA or RNA helicase